MTQQDRSESTSEKQDSDDIFPDSSVEGVSVDPEDSENTSGVGGSEETVPLSDVVQTLLTHLRSTTSIVSLYNFIVAEVPTGVPHLQEELEQIISDSQEAHDLFRGSLALLMLPDYQYSPFYALLRRSLIMKYLLEEWVDGG